MKTKRILTLLISLLVVFSLVGCSNKSSSSSNESKSITITDREGKSISIPKNVEKIVSMSPTITETLVHLGLADKIVAIDTYSTDISGIKKGLPTFDMMKPDTEKLIALKPDVIFATGMSKSDGDDPYKAVKDSGVLLTYVPASTSIQGIKDDIAFLGKVTNKEDKAKEIVDTFTKEMNDVKSKIESVKSSKSVYFEIAEPPHTTSFGKNTFLNEMLEMLGAKNVFGDQESWVSVSEESIIKKNPDVIFTNTSYVEGAVSKIKARNGWNVINAVKNNNVYMIDLNKSSRSNEYVVDALKDMAKALYPNAFK